MLNRWPAEFEKFTDRNRPANFERKAIKPFSMLCIAPSDSGKTYMIKSVYNSSLRNAFDMVVVYSKTNKYNNQYSFLGNKLVNHEKFSDESLELLTEKQNDFLRECGRLLNILVIFDDISDKKMKVNDNVNDIFAMGRHLGISCIYSVQKTTMVSTVIRSNANITVIWKCLGPDRVYVRKEILGCQVDPDDYKSNNHREVLDDIILFGWKERFQALVVDRRGNNFTTFDRLFIFKAE